MSVSEVHVNTTVRAWSLHSSSLFSLWSSTFKFRSDELSIHSLCCFFQTCIASSLIRLIRRASSLSDEHPVCKCKVSNDMTELITTVHANCLFIWSSRSAQHCIDSFWWCIFFQNLPAGFWLLPASQPANQSLGSLPKNQPTSQPAS